MRRILLVPAALAAAIFSRGLDAPPTPSGTVAVASAGRVVSFTGGPLPSDLFRMLGLSSEVTGPAGTETRAPGVPAVDGIASTEGLVPAPPPPAPALPPAPPVRNAPTPTAAAAVAPGGLEGVLACIRQHESNNNYQATNGIYRGAYQFDLTTWQSVGGSGDPVDASPAEQDERAALLYSQRGIQPWPQARC